MKVCLGELCTRRSSDVLKGGTAVICVREQKTEKLENVDGLWRHAGHILKERIFSETLLELFVLLLVQLLLAPMVLLLPVTKICVNILVGHC